MSAERDGALARWWPTTQAMDLVEASPEAVAGAIGKELERIAAGERLAIEKHFFADLDAAFSSVEVFANIPTWYLVLPSASRWTAVWTNCFLCDGHDSMCWCLTRNHELRTLHWSAHDEVTTFQPGATFTHRASVRGEPAERHVYVGREDRRWIFRQSGEPLAEEDLSAYAARRMRDRLDEAGMMALLGRLGAWPWREDFYALAPGPCYLVGRLDPPATVLTRSRSEVLGRD